MPLRTARTAPYLFLAPFVLSFLIFGAYPIVRSVMLSFYITSGPEAQHFVGLDNYLHLLQDPDFWTAVRNTATFALGSVLLQLPLSLGLALLLNRADIRGRNVFRFIFFSPNLMGLVFSALLFMLILAPRFGLLNAALHALFGLPSTTRWLSTPGLVMPALIMVALWLYTGFNMVYFLAALQAVDGELYEAATIDGAGRWAQFRHVTLPGIRPVLIFVVVLSTIGSFQLFELAFLLLGNSSGPDQAGLTIVMYLYQNGFLGGDLGYAAAIGWTLALMVLLLALVQLRITGTGKEAR
ncbi:carbohydrate ABC transporter permease [Desulfatitalea tepidiphila]|uniref:carbohydrate ABC transporter permease n=1 Tax=Desulfatitalea tepidiphila TaxID=1185843 RepID=UPI0006B559DD|nr:sugar ABC transporter permease [Desulfatitalea tepidiphila]